MIIPYLLRSSFFRNKLDLSSNEAIPLLISPKHGWWSSSMLGSILQVFIELTHVLSASPFLVFFLLRDLGGDWSSSSTTCAACAEGAFMNRSHFRVCLVGDQNLPRQSLIMPHWEFLAAPTILCVRVAAEHCFVQGMVPGTVVLT